MKKKEKQLQEQNYSEIIYISELEKVSLAAVGRWSERVEGLEPSNAIEEFLDERFHDERMEQIYANMEW